MVLHFAKSKPLNWEDSCKVNIKNIAAKQIIYHCVDKKGDDCLWGDEVEYTILNNDNTPNKKCFEYISNIDSKKTKWMIEYASWMIEGIPSCPYNTLETIEGNLL